MKADGLNLKTGMSLYIQRIRTDGVTEVLSCNLIGFVEGQGLIVKPHDDSTLASLNVGEKITTRMSVGDSRYAFSCTILTLNEQPYTHIHLSYPEEISGIMKRAAPRFHINMPIRLSLHIGVDIVSVLISDISSSGACLLSESPLGGHADTLNIEFRVPFDQTLLTLPCVVRYVLTEQEDGKHYYRHGVAFQFVSDEDQWQLNQFIEMLINKQYAVPGISN